MNADIAIIGMAARLPEADTIKAFRRNLVTGKDSIRDLSLARKSNSTIAPDKEYQKVGFIEDIHSFDPAFFGISMTEAIHMAPQQRMLMEVVYEALEDAGYNIDDLNGSRTDVFVADTELEYYKHAETFDPTLLTGNKNAAMAGRIARYFNFLGKAVMVDTTCSSSLAALYFAVNELILGEADYAVICAANLHLFPTERDSDVRIGIESRNEKVMAFSEDADGTVGGEAITCFVLKRLDEALSDHDNIQAVIKGVSMNQDASRSSSLTAPDSISQAEVLIRTWNRAKINPRSISYIEAHGTGTKLGDPIEIQGIDLAFQKFTTDKKFCAVSSVKSNVGHADSAAGAVGLIKVILSLKHGELYPSLHVNRTNPFIDFDNSATYVNTSCRPWQPAGRRIAGISSFGIMGTNCHAVLAEHPAEDNPVVDIPGTYMIVESGRSEADLSSNVKSLSNFLQESTALSIRDVSYTLLVGRKHYRYRYIVWADTLSSLVDALRSYDPGSVTEVTDDHKQIFVFPNSAEGVLDCHGDLSLRHEIFRTTFQRCQQLSPSVPGEKNDSAVQTFCFQYSFYQLLSSLGLETKYLIGDGVGKIVISVLKNEISLEEGLRRAATSVVINSDLRQRAKKFYEQYASSEKLVLCVIGPAGELTRVLAEEGQQCTVNIVSLNATFSDLVPNFLMHIYRAGGDINWRSYAKSISGKRISLPAYQFQKTRCWLKPALDLEQFRGNRGWYYRLTWNVDPAPVPERHGRHHYVIFMDHAGIGERLLDVIDPENARTVIYPAKNFKRVDASRYEMSFEDHQQMELLHRSLTDVLHTSPVFIHLGACATAPDIDQSFDAGIFSLLSFAKAFDKELQGGRISLAVITRGARNVAEGDVGVLAPFQSTLHGFVNALASEYPATQMRCVDMDHDTRSWRADSILSECEFRDDFLNVAHRRGERFLPSLEKYRLTGSVNKAGNEPRGVIVVTGGAGGIGLEVVKHLAGTTACAFVILGRTPVPLKSEWDAIANQTEHRLYALVHAVRDLSAKAKTVAYIACDVSNGESVVRAFEDIRQNYGAIAGVVHAAGIPGKKRARSHSRESFMEALQPKVYGTINLACCLQADSFFIMFSSDDAMIGNERNTNYSAANMFLDNYAYVMRCNGIRAKVVSWPSWSETGMWARFAANSKDVNRTLRGVHLSNSEGLQVFSEMMSADFDHVIISKKDPQELLGKNRYFKFGNTAVVGKQEPSAVTRVQTVENVVIDPTWTLFQNAVAAAWQETLQADVVALESDFFDLGGHSLLGIDVIGKIEDRFGVQLEFDDIFKYPTVRALAGFIESLVESKTATSVSIPAVEEQDYYRISLGQFGLWNLCQLPEASVAYNSRMVYKVEGTIDSGRLHAAVRMLLQKHESLRTVFTVMDGIPRQRFLPVAHGSFDRAFVHYEDEQANRSALHEMIQAAISEPMNFDCGPLVRFHLIRLAHNEHVFIHVIHHIISDGWSEAILLNDLMDAYESQKEEKPPVRELPIQFKDYCSRANKEIAKNDDLRYWLNKLRNVSQPFHLPADHARPALKTYSGDTVRFAIHGSRYQKVTRLARDNNTTLFIVLVSLLKCLFFKYTSQTDISVGTVLTGRGHKDLQDQIGFYINTVVLRTEFLMNDRFADLLGKVKQSTLEAYEHQSQPLFSIAESMNYHVNPDHSPFFDIFVILHNKRDELVSPETKKLKLVRMDEDTGAPALYDLSFEFNETDSSLEVDLHYNIALFRKESVELLRERFLRICDIMADDPDMALNDADIRLPFEKSIEESIRGNFDVEEAF